MSPKRNAEPEHIGLILARLLEGLANRYEVRKSNEGDFEEDLNLVERPGIPWADGKPLLSDTQITEYMNLAGAVGLIGAP